MTRTYQPVAVCGESRKHGSEREDWEAIPSSTPTREKRFMTFVKDIISSSVEEGNQPLVMIDSSNCVRLWPWLADHRINANNIEFKMKSGSPLYEHMQEEWQGARIIRIRQELAPGIIEKKDRELAETTLEDARDKKELKPTYWIPSASSPMELFRLNVITGTNCSAYLSVGRKTLQQEFRGQSCYRGIEKPVPLKTSDAKEKVKNPAGLVVHELTTISPFTDQWPTPNPLEIVVTLRQPEDDCDRLAALVESLRYGFGHYGDWTSLPAPLFFERVVRDYISAFTLSDEEDEAEED
ncbi:MAG: RNAseH domain-containing protein [Hormoscilla sp. GM7CHS1pb]|nr:RNAseH domain-containing protein [Hormoscilla sp. GM7CHS1pb]